MVSLVGLDSVMDYRLAANEMMNTGLGTVGLVFRITSSGGGKGEQRGESRGEKGLFVGVVQKRPMVI